MIIAVYKCGKKADLPWCRLCKSSLR